MVDKLRAFHDDFINLIIVAGLLIYLLTGNGAYEIQSVIVGGLIGCLRMSTGNGKEKQNESH